MAIPLRNDLPEEELTTADIANPERPTDKKGPEAVTAARTFERGIDRGDDRSADPNIEHGVYQNPERLSDHDEHAEILEEPARLFPDQELGTLRDRWKEIQTGFVDEPRKAVEQADGLVASAMKRLAEVFAKERSTLEQQWDRGDSVSTEDLRVALQRYRTFFHRLLSV
jgi:hypothetical protein